MLQVNDSTESGVFPLKGNILSYLNNELNLTALFD